MAVCAFHLATGVVLVTPADDLCHSMYLYAPVCCFGRAYPWEVRVAFKHSGVFVCIWICFRFRGCGAGVRQGRFVDPVVGLGCFAALACVCGSRCLRASLTR